MAPRKPDIPCSYCPKHLSPQSDSPPTECILSNGAPCLACARQIKLAVQIEETKKLLDKLVTEEHQARMDVNNYHDPCHRLPVEIISHIFRLTLPKFALQSKVEYWPSDQKVPSEPWVLRLGAVCQRWRQIAWSTPRLWSTMMLSLHWREPTDSKIDVVREWLKRSKPLPLSIRLYLSEQSSWAYDGPDREDIESINMQRFIKLVGEESERWKNLSLQCHQRHLEDLIKYTEGAPYLQTLQLIPRYLPPREIIWSDFIIRGPKPQPDHVIAMGYPQLQDIGISWKNVTKVTVEDLGLAHCIRLLLISPKLVEVHFQKIASSCNADLSKNIPQTPKNVPHLRILSISSSEPFQAILDSITLPSLEEFSINVVHRGPTGGYQFTPTSAIEFLDRSSCPLTFFALKDCACDESDFINFLYRLPSSVEKVELDIQKLGAYREDFDLIALFNHLSRAPTATSRTSPSSDSVLPNLKDFKYKVFIRKRSEFPWHLLPSLLRPLSGEPRPLEKLTIIDRDCFKEIPPPLLAKGEKFDESMVRGLIKMMEDGVELFLPCKVSSQELLALLE